METSSISLNNQTESTSTTSTSTSKNTYSRFFCNPSLLVANFFYILYDQKSKTTTSSTKNASVPTGSWDNPMTGCDPSGEFTVGVCGELLLSVVVLAGSNTGGNICLQRDQFESSDEIGFSETTPYIGAVGYSLGGSISAELMVSNADSISKLAGWFYDVSVGVDILGGVSGSVFWGKSASNSNVIGVAIGPGIGIEAGSSLPFTYTWVQVAHNSFTANSLRILWDSILPELATKTYVTKVLRDASHYLSRLGKKNFSNVELCLLIPLT